MISKQINSSSFFYDGSEQKVPYLSVSLLNNDSAPSSTLDLASVDLNSGVPGIQHQAHMYVWAPEVSMLVLYNVSYDAQIGIVTITPIPYYSWLHEEYGYEAWDINEVPTALAAVGAVELSYEQRELSLSDYVDCYNCTKLTAITVDIPYTVSNIAGEAALAAIVLPLITAEVVIL